MKLHKSITAESIMAAIAEDNHSGICTSCGAEHGWCDPDARKFKCESCGDRAVYGAEELLFYIA